MPAHPAYPTSVPFGATDAYVDGVALKQSDVPVETMLGAFNGAITGALLSSAVSMGVTAAKHGREELLTNTLRNIGNGHLAGVLAGTASIAAMSALVRYSRASKHNEWVDRHYDFLDKRSGTLPAENPEPVAANVRNMPYRPSSYVGRLDAEQAAETPEAAPAR
jgi:hypothetical protein